MELKRPYPGTELLYWEYGTPENTREKQELREDQGNQLQRWEVSGMLQKFRSFRPISLLFLNLCFVILFRSPSLH